MSHNSTVKDESRVVIGAAASGLRAAEAWADAEFTFGESIGQTAGVMPGNTATCKCA